ncbi:MAG: EF-hand domain-containing protein [Pseudohongiellaceae bacterium]
MYPFNKKLISGFALTLVAAQVMAQDSGSVSASDAIASRINGDQQMELRLAQESAAILVLRSDSDSDGIISQSEFVAAETDSISERFGIRDVDLDGRLSAEETGRDGERHRRPGLDVNIKLYRLCMAEVYGQTPEHDDRFRLADTDGDGFLSQLEFSTYLQERAFVQFMRLDLNDDGLLTHGELVGRMQERRHYDRLVRACRELASDLVF